MVSGVPPWILEVVYSVLALGLVVGFAVVGTGRFGGVFGLVRGFLFFFFQAEDGIRDLTVTGVQTCALPILSRGQGGDELRRCGGLRRAGECPRRARQLRAGPLARARVLSAARPGRAHHRTGAPTNRTPLPGPRRGPHRPGWYCSPPGPPPLPFRPPPPDAPG